MIKFNLKQRSKMERRKDAQHFSIFASSHFSFNCGYTLLFAMIVASVVLAIGVSLLTISRKEFILSSSATESSAAFYAADSGINCAEYWNVGTEFGTSTANVQNPSPVKCAEVPGLSNVTVSGFSSDDKQITISLPDGVQSPQYEFTFNTPFSIDGTIIKSCARVTVDKYYAPNPGLGGVMYPYTTITSYGYNIGWDINKKDCSSQSPRKVERAIQVTY